MAACFSGADEKGNVWPGCPCTLDVTGCWYDAGDHGRYAVNGGIAVWRLQNLYNTGLVGSLFADGQTRLPKAGNRRDDLLDEARWEVEWMLRLQVPAGTHTLPVGPHDCSGRLALTPVDAGGMAHNKVADAHSTMVPTAPADDKEPRLL